MNLTPILVTFAAGFATVLGALFVSEKRNGKLEGFALAFATGMMLMISLGELFPEASENLGLAKAIVFLALGASLSLLLDIILPHHHHHEHDKEHEKQPGHYIEECECTHGETISRGMIIALVLHNVLEGLATGTTVASDIALGIPMAIGIAIHNIPIGATLALSVMSSGKVKSKAVLGAFIIGLSQPLGALFGSLFLVPETALCISNAVVSGILIFISFDELWPAARLSCSRNITIFALLLGIAFIPLSEVLI